MRYELSVSCKGLLNECITQTSVDFQALRVMAPSVDVAYEDFAMFQSDKEAFFIQLRSELDQFYASRPAIVESYDMNGEEVLLTINIKRELIPNGLAFILKDFLKMAILRWWYMGRNERYYDIYSMQYGVALSRLDSMSRTTLAKRPYNYI